ncbi:MAG: alpha/beta hydrolase family protein [Myxococcales bacterium]|nr:alpha/beta hydrolase family protein [Myxococcales bacterium]
MSWSDTAAGWLDAAVTHRRQGRTGDRRVSAMSTEERLARLQTLREIYGDPALLEPGAFFQPGAPIAPGTTRVRTARGPALDLSWPSTSVPFDPEVGEAYAAVASNRTAWARLFRAGPRPGPIVVVVHGYGAGHVRLESVVWPLRRWLRAGVDVVLPALPFHARRGEPGRLLSPRFPAADVRFTHEGFRQAIHDLRCLIGWLRAQGHGPIAVAGMSLGGYTTALLATLDDDLARIALVIPLASLADFARDRGRLGDGPEVERLHEALEAVYAPSSPLSRPPRIAPDRVRVVAARGDRITGVEQARRLANHFGAEVELTPGSHLVQRLPWPSLADWLDPRR